EVVAGAVHLRERHAGVWEVRHWWRSINRRRMLSMLDTTSPPPAPTMLPGAAVDPETPSRTQVTRRIIRTITDTTRMAAETTWTMRIPAGARSPEGVSRACRASGSASDRAALRSVSAAPLDD